MTNPKGAQRERWLVDLLERGTSLDARKAEHNGAGRDVDIRADVLRIVEDKDRQQLNVHKTLRHTQDNHPGYPPAVVWHRVSKAAGAKRSTPDGPTLACLPVPDWVDLLDIADSATRYLAATAGTPLDVDGIGRRSELALALASVTTRYPDAAGAFK